MPNPLRFPRWLGRGRKPVNRPAVTLARYTRPGYWHHHRVLAFVLLGLLCSIYGFLFSLGTTFILIQLLVPLAVAAVFVVFLLPENGTVYERTQESLLFAFLVVLLCWPDYIAIAIPGLPWITFIRLTTIPLLAVFLVNLAQSRGFRTELASILSASRPVGTLVAGFAVIALVSVVFSAKLSYSANKWFVLFSTNISVFFVSAYVFTRPGRVVKLGYFLWASAILVCLIGLQEWRHQVIPWAGHIPGIFKIDAETQKLIYGFKGRAATGIYRIQSKFTTPLALAEFLSLAAPFVLHLGFTIRSWKVRIGAALTLPLLLYVITLTDSRLGIVGLVITFLAYFLYFGFTRWKRVRSSLFGPAIVLSYPALFFAVVMATFFVGRLRARVWGTGAQQASTEARQEQLAQGIPMVLKHPWGHGIGRAAETLGFSDGEGLLTIDSYYLSVALEFGILGFIIYYGMFLWSIGKGATSLPRSTNRDTEFIAPLTIALANFVVIKSILSQQENHPLAFVLLGALCALIYRCRADARDFGKFP